MPAQTSQNKTDFYVRLDTAPDLQRCLKQGDEPIDLTGAAVTISISYAMRSGGFVLFPRDLIVFQSPCVVDPDQTEDGRRGWVSWTPPENALTPSGRFQFTFEITYVDGTHQTVPANTWLTMVIQPKVGGPLVNSGASSQTNSPPVFPSP